MGPLAKRYLIEASRCTLREGQRVAPGEELGQDLETGMPVVCECRGVVEAVRFGGAEHSLWVVIRCEE